MVTMLKNKCSLSKRIKFPTLWYNCYYFTWSDTYFIQLETLLINHPSYVSLVTLSAAVIILHIMMRRSLRKDEHKGHCWILWNVARDLSTEGVNSGCNKDDINSAKVVIQKAASMYKLDHKSMFLERSVIEKRSFATKWFYVPGF